MVADKTTEYLRNRREAIKDAAYSDECQDAILLFLAAYDPDNSCTKPPIIHGKDRREQTLATSSRLAYASSLHRAAEYFDLTKCTTSDLNRLADERLSGVHESVDDDGVSQNTIHQNQVAWRAFARFHQSHPEGSDIEMDPDRIVLVDREDAKVDERDMFDAGEVEALRNATKNKRDRALLEMLIYTGQRNNALRMLKIKHVQPEKGESGKLHIPDIEGMKGAEGKRPLLGAEKAAWEWLQAHPTGKPDDAYFTHVYDWSGHDDIEPGDHLSKQSFGRIPKRIAKRAGVEKPAHPHNFRHYFVTMAISKHGMSMDTVRHLIGHAPGSRELERTYQHLVDEDHIENAELDMGIRQERDESLTPSECPRCDESLEPHYNRCPSCRMVFSPTAEVIKEGIESKKVEREISAEDEQTREDVRKLAVKLDNPEMLDLIASDDAVGPDLIKKLAESVSN
jgi:site-specific recombinase XerD